MTIRGALRVTRLIVAKGISPVSAGRQSNQSFPPAAFPSRSVSNTNRMKELAMILDFGRSGFSAAR